MDEFLTLTKAERIFYKSVAVIFIVFVFLETVLRLSFNLFPVHIRAELHQVRLVPWMSRPIVSNVAKAIYDYPYNAIPYSPDGIIQIRVLPELQDHEVYWGDAHFRVNTVRIWDTHFAGFRSAPARYPLDVMTFGDGFTFCWTEYADCWVTQLAERYGNWFNAATPGTGTAGQFALMQQIVPPTKPRLVIWTWYADDLRDSYRYDIIKTGAAPFAYYLPLINPSTKPLNASAMFMTVRLVELALGLNHDPNRVNYEVARVNNHNTRVATPERPHPAALSWGANRYGLYRAQEMFDQARRFLREQVGAELLIVLIPTKEEVYGDALRARFGAAYVEAAGEARRALVEYLEANGFKFVDALPALQAAAQKGEVPYYSMSEFLNASGNKVLAQAVAEQLDREQLLAAR